jgi:hypothetical protein
MKDEEMQRFALILAQTLQQSRSVSDSEHYDHHVFIAERIKQVKASRAFWESLSAHVAKWGAVSIISAGGYALYLGVKQMMRAAA